MDGGVIQRLMRCNICPSGKMRRAAILRRGTPCGSFLINHHDQPHCNRSVQPIVPKQPPEEAMNNKRRKSLDNQRLFLSAPWSCSPSAQQLLLTRVWCCETATNILCCRLRASIHQVHLSDLHNSYFTCSCNVDLQYFSHFNSSFSPICRREVLIITECNSVHEINFGMTVLHSLVKSFPFFNLALAFIFWFSHMLACLHAWSTTACWFDQHNVADSTICDRWLLASIRLQELWKPQSRNLLDTVISAIWTNRSILCFAHNQRAKAPGRNAVRHKVRGWRLQLQPDVGVWHVNKHRSGGALTDSWCWLQPSLQSCLDVAQLHPDTIWTVWNKATDSSWSATPDLAPV